jgi:DNA-binding SARP family transcriptional activator/tetratricopeptide (TPR) repeat protein
MLHVIGPPFWLSAGERIPLTQREALLLAYLAEKAPLAVRREGIVDMFWPTSLRRRGLRSLSQLVYQINKKLPEVHFRVDQLHVAVSPMRTDLDLMREYAERRAFLEPETLVRGELFGGPIVDNAELELWRTAKAAEFLVLLEDLMQRVLEDPTATWSEGLETVIDRLIETGYETPSLRLAQIIIHYRKGNISKARGLHTRMVQDGADAPDWQFIETAAVAAPTKRELFEVGRDNIPFIGRKPELELLSDKLRRAISGEGSLVVLQGEPGIGKTRLASQLLRRAALKGCRVWTAKAHSAFHRVPFATIKAILDSNNITASRNDVAGMRTDPLGTGVLHEGSHDSDRLRWIESVCQLVENQTLLSPLVLFVDDAQWADEPTVQFLVFMALRVSKLRLLVILTRRTEDPEALAAWSLHDIPAASYMTVQPLTPDDAHLLVRAYETHTSMSLPPDTCHAVLKNTSGRPFLLLEALASVTRDGGTLSGTQLITISETAEELMLRRFQDLQSHVHWVYGLVAVAGEPLRIADLPSITGMSAVAVSQSLEIAVKRGILEVSDLRIRFPHDLMKEVAYRNLAPAMRVLLHKTFGDYLCSHGADPGAVAQHLDRAGSREAAADYAMLAAKRAERESRYQDKEFYYNLAIKNGDRHQRHEAALALARHLIKAERGSEVRVILPHIDHTRHSDALIVHKLAELGERLRDNATPVQNLVTAAVEIAVLAQSSNATDLISIVGSLLDIALYAPEKSFGDALITNFEQLAANAGDHALESTFRCATTLWRVVTDGYQTPIDTISHWDMEESLSSGLATLQHFTVGTVNLIAGNLIAAEDCLLRAAAIAEQIGDRTRYSAACGNLGIVYTELGNFEAAQRYLEVHLVSPTYVHRLRTLGNLAILKFEEGDSLKAIEFCNGLLEANRFHEAPTFYNTAHALIALCHLRSHRPELAEPHVKAILPSQDPETPLDGDVPYLVDMLVQWLLYQRQTSSAFAVLDSYGRQVRGRNRLAELRLRLTTAAFYAITNNDLAYGMAKGVLAESTECGAKLIANRARAIMDVSR